MSGGVAVHRSDDGQRVGMTSQMGIDAADGQSAFSMLLEGKETFGQMPDGSAVGPHR